MLSANKDVLQESLAGSSVLWAAAQKSIADIRDARFGLTESSPSPDCSYGIT